jgi:hypothetical protein
VASDIDGMGFNLFHLTGLIRTGSRDQGIGTKNLCVRRAKKAMRRRRGFLHKIGQFRNSQFVYRIAESHLKTDHGQLITEHFHEGRRKKRYIPKKYS